MRKSTFRYGQLKPYLYAYMECPVAFANGKWLFFDTFGIRFFSFGEGTKRKGAGRGEFK